MSLITTDRAYVAGAFACATGAVIALLLPTEDAPPLPPLPNITAIPRHPALSNGAAADLPLFTESRSPVEEEPETEEGAAPVQQSPLPTVVGVAAGRGTAILLAKNVSGETVPLKIGDEVDGWRLVAIRASGGTFEREGSRVEIGLDFRNKTAKPDASNGSAVAAPVLPLPPAHDAK